MIRMIKNLHIAALLAALLSFHALHASSDPNRGDEESLDKWVHSLILDESVSSFGQFSAIVFDEHPFVSKFFCALETNAKISYCQLLRESMDKTWAKKAACFIRTNPEDPYGMMLNTLGQWSQASALEQQPFFASEFKQFVAMMTEKYKYMFTDEKELADYRKKFYAKEQLRIIEAVDSISVHNLIKKVCERFTKSKQSYSGDSYYQEWKYKEMWFAHVVRTHIKRILDALKHPLLKAVGINTLSKFIAPSIDRYVIKLNDDGELYDPTFEMLADLRQSQLEVLSLLKVAADSLKFDETPLLVSKIRLIRALKGVNYLRKHIPSLASFYRADKAYVEMSYDSSNKLIVDTYEGWQSVLGCLDQLTMEDLSHLIGVVYDHYADDRHAPDVQEPYLPFAFTLYASPAWNEIPADLQLLSIQQLFCKIGYFNPKKRSDLINILKVIGHLHAVWVASKANEIRQEYKAFSIRINDCDSSDDDCYYEPTEEIKRYRSGAKELGELLKNKKWEVALPEADLHKHNLQAAMHLYEISKSRKEDKHKLLFALWAVKILEKTASRIPNSILDTELSYYIRPAFIEIDEQGRSLMKKIFREAIELSKKVVLCEAGQKTLLSAFYGLALLKQKQEGLDKLKIEANELINELKCKTERATDSVHDNNLNDNNSVPDSTQQKNYFKSNPRAALEDTQGKYEAYWEEDN